jgi:hypothetical protein
MCRQQLERARIVFGLFDDGPRQRFVSVASRTPPKPRRLFERRFQRSADAKPSPFLVALLI